MKSAGSLLGLPLAGWPSSLLSPSLPLCSSPLQGQSLDMTASVSSKSDSPLHHADKTPSVPSPALEMPKSLDHPCPQPIPDGQSLANQLITCSASG